MVGLIHVRPRLHSAASASRSRGLVKIAGLGIECGRVGDVDPARAPDPSLDGFGVVAGKGRHVGTAYPILLHDLECFLLESGREVDDVVLSKPEWVERCGVRGEGLGR